MPALALVGTAAPAGGLADAGPRPELCWLPVDRLSVDQSYQRTIDTRAGQNLIGRIAERFTWSAFQAILACPDGGGGWFIIDGQHRVAAAKLCGIAEVPAVVVAAGGAAEQARAFIIANDDRVAVNQYAKHHARLVAGDPEALATDALCRKFGMSIPRYPIPSDQLKPGQTLALASFRTLPRRYGDAVAKEAFRIIAEAYRDKPGGLRAAFFAGAADWLARTTMTAAERQRRTENLIRELRQRPWADLDARSQARKMRYGGTLITSVAAILGHWAGASPSADRARLMAGR